MLELILRGLEKLSSYVVRFLRWVGVVGTNTPVVSSQDTEPPTEQNAELLGETDEAIRWLNEISEMLEREQAKMPNKRYYAKIEDIAKNIWIGGNSLSVSGPLEIAMYKQPATHVNPFDKERYFCKICGRSNVKLWRAAKMFGDDNDEVELLCAFCLGDMKGESLRGSKDLGKKVTKLTTLFDYFPAIPMMAGNEYQGFLTIRQASDDNVLVGAWLKLGD